MPFPRGTSATLPNATSFTPFTHSSSFGLEKCQYERERVKQRTVSVERNKASERMTIVRATFI